MKSKTGLSEHNGAKRMFSNTKIVKERNQVCIVNLGYTGYEVITYNKFEKKRQSSYQGTIFFLETLPLEELIHLLNRKINANTVGTLLNTTFGHNKMFVLRCKIELNFSRILNATIGNPY